MPTAEVLKSLSVPIYIVLAIVAGFFAWAVILIATAKGDQTKTDKGNKILLWTIIGFVIFSVCFLIFIFGGKIITGKNIVNNQQTSQDEFPPAPYQESFPPAQQ